MKKQFLYCESNDGGMDTQLVTHSSKLRLYRWMAGDCAPEDKQFALWMEDAEVGEMKEHRLGVCIRLRDGTDR